MSTAISVRDLGKKYSISHQSQSNNITLRETMTESFKSIFSKGNAPIKEDFWALSHVSFDIEEGDTIGILGRNGAGKSTLLKLLSRITEPSTGSIDIKGKVVSLLEVGTGFHQELTGRENIFLNGAILGMSMSQIKKKFDTIVEFAEVENFLDTPVKRYSSGMYVRLAFAIAAHLEPDILIVDEVLAVGDSQFQKKCINKMADVGQRGCTVLLVSHSIGYIKKLCNKGIFLNKGTTEGIDKIEHVMDLYMGTAKTNEIFFEREVLKRASIKQIDEELELIVAYELDHKISLPNLGFVISDSQGNPICGSNLIMDPPQMTIVSVKSGEIRVIIEYPKLLNGTYRLSLWFGDSIEDYFIARDCLMFDVINMVKTAQWPSSEVGAVKPKCKWFFE